MSSAVGGSSREEELPSSDAFQAAREGSSASRARYSETDFLVPGRYLDSESGKKSSSSLLLLFAWEEVGC